MAGQCSMTTKSSVCTVPLSCHSDNRINLKQSRLLLFPLSDFHRNAGSRVLLSTGVNLQNTVSFQCRCTNKKNPPEIKTFGPMKDGMSNLNIKWIAVFFTPILEILRLKIEPRYVSFDKLVGVDNIIRPFRRFIRILRRDHVFKKYNVSLPKGVLLYGPPGTGKTTLVHAMAHEAKMSFFPLSARDVATRAGAVRIERIFNEARIWSPSIVFVEDLDIIGGEQRNPESDAALKKLLSEMDKGHRDKDGKLVLVIAATNRIESLDEELYELRHFSKTLRVAKPDEECRRKMFGLYLEEFILEEDKEAICILVAKSTPGLVWGDLQEIGDESTRLAARRGGDHVTLDDVRQAIERVNGNLRIDER